MFGYIDDLACDWNRAPLCGTGIECFALEVKLRPEYSGLFSPGEITNPKTSHGINLFSLFGPGEIAENWASHGINLFGLSD